MSRATSCRCLGCGCNDEKRCAGGCTFTLRDVFSRLGVCSRCIGGKRGATLRESFTHEVEKCRATVAGV